MKKNETDKLFRKEEIEDHLSHFSDENKERSNKENLEHPSPKGSNIKNIIIVSLVGILFLVLIFLVPFNKSIDRVFPVVVEKGGNIHKNEKAYVYVKGNMKAPLIYFGEKEFKGNIMISYIDIPGQDLSNREQTRSTVKKGINRSDINWSTVNQGLTENYYLANLKSKGLFKSFEIEILNFGEDISDYNLEKVKEQYKDFLEYENDRIFGPAFTVKEKEAIKEELRIDKK